MPQVVNTLAIRIFAPLTGLTASFITKIEGKSGVKFHEAQVAFACQYASEDTASMAGSVLTLSGPHQLFNDKTPPETETVPIPESETAARQLVEKFENGSEYIGADEEVSDTVTQHRLANNSTLLEERWLGTPEEELNA